MTRRVKMLAALAGLCLLVAATPGMSQIRPKGKVTTIEDLKAAVQKNPNDASAYYKLGLAYSQRGAEDQAIKALKEAVKLKPDFEDAKASLSDAYDRQGVDLAQGKRYQDAEKAFTEAIRANPKDSRPYFNLGVSYGQQARWSDAAGAFQQAIQRNPNDPYARYNLGMTYLMIDKNTVDREQYQAYRRAALEQYRTLTNMGSPMAGQLFYGISNPQTATYPTSSNWQRPPQSEGQPPGPP